MKKILPLILLIVTCFSNAQVSKKETEKFPIFPSCAGLQFQALETCFYNEVQDFVFNNFKVPENLKQNDFKAKQPRVRYYTMGSNKWQQAESFPLPNTEIKDFFLNYSHH